MNHPETKTPGLYIHIPFCRRKCGYCDFYSETSIELIPGFLDALCREMTHYRGLFGTFDSIYLGGGTPSVLGPGEIDLVLTAAHDHFDIAANCEVTLEANPADIDFQDLQSIRKMGVNRLNIGIQSFHRPTLDFLGRRHNADDALRSFAEARRAGFRNIGLDLIYGVPGQSIDLWVCTLMSAIDLAPEHLSCYQLSLSENTPLGNRHLHHEFFLPDEDLSLHFFTATAGLLAEAGYAQYEVSNFARDPSRMSRHNQKYWNHSPYLGLGPGAHSFLRDRRWQNHCSIKIYSDMSLTGRRPVESEERLTSEDRMLESLFLGLRTVKGIDLEEFYRVYRIGLMQEKKEILSRLEAEGLVVLRDGWLRPTIRGLAVADSLALI